MFIKWREQGKPLSAEKLAELDQFRPVWATGKKRDPKEHRYFAYLAKSARVEGKPKQQIMAYLGSIPVGCAHEEESEEWRTFWFKVVCTLALKRTSQETFRDACFELAKRVTRPDHDALMTLVGDKFQWYPRWKKDYQPIYEALVWADRAWTIG